MKIAKRITAATLALALTFGLAACGSDSEGSTKTTTPAQTLNTDQIAAVEDVASQLPDIELANKEVIWLAHFDINPELGKVMPVDLALFEEKYGAKIVYRTTTWDTRYSDLATSVLGNDAPDLFPAGDMDTFPKGAIKSMFQPIDPYIDLDSDLWSDTSSLIKEKFNYNGSNYVAVVQATAGNVCIYNRNVVAENNFDDPADLFAAGDWNWDTFKKMCIDFTDESQLKYALDGWWFENALMQTAGVPAIGMEDGLIVNNLMDPTLEKVQNFMYDLQKNKVVYPRNLINNWNLRGDAGVGVGTGLTLFWPCGLWALETALENTKEFGNVKEGDVMFVPMPTDPDSDIYYTSAGIDAYVIPMGAKNPEGAAAYLNCKKVAAQDPKTLQIGLDQLTNDYGWTQEMVDMKATITQMAQEHPVLEFYSAISADMQLMLDAATRGTMIPGEQTWTEIRSEWNEAVQAEVDAQNKQVAS